MAQTIDSCNPRIMWTWTRPELLTKNLSSDIEPSTPQLRNDNNAPLAPRQGHTELCSLQVSASPPPRRRAACRKVYFLNVAVVQGSWTTPDPLQAAQRSALGYRCSVGVRVFGARPDLRHFATLWWSSFQVGTTFICIFNLARRLQAYFNMSIFL